MAISRVQQEDQTNQAKWTPELKMQAGRELVAALLGVILLLCTGYVVFKMLAPAQNSASIEAQKDILTVMTGLLGVVLGYYFGRTPADARAAQAQEQANAAEERAGQAQEQAILARGRVALAQEQASAKADKLEQVRAKAQELITNASPTLRPPNTDAEIEASRSRLQDLWVGLQEIVALSRS